MILAEHTREVVRYLDIYEAVYGHWAEVSDDLKMITQIFKRLHRLPLILNLCNLLYINAGRWKLFRNNGSSVSEVQP
ncbi:MAG: hypothetical protein QME64_00980 [bacterium]|nr:hypothetical protein [bacterium]